MYIIWVNFLFVFLKIFWSIVALQCRVSFYCAAKGISFMYTYITSWEIDGETVETGTDFISLAEITADGDCSHEIKRRLLRGRKAMTNLNSILKIRDVTLWKRSV